MTRADIIGGACPQRLDSMTTAKIAGKTAALGKNYEPGLKVTSTVLLSFAARVTF